MNDKTFLNGTVGVSKKVLVIEDSPIQAQALQKVLEEHGLRVLWVEEGRVGVELAQQWRPDIVVVDLNMPNMDGFEVCRYLRESPHTSHIPIVVLTAHDSVPNRRMGIYLGAVDFIPKDEFANVVLLETLRQLRILNDGEDVLVEDDDVATV
ncbi:MAG: response regulator [Anaerolineae bacterium]|nr:response regulator [Anaerolineae bacterium]